MFAGRIGILNLLSLSLYGVLCVLEPDTCSEGGFWGEWEAKNPCNKLCGGCGRIEQTRECLSLQQNCTCKGPERRLTSCGHAYCVGLDKECCDGYVKGILGNKWACVPEPKELHDLSQASEVRLEVCKGQWEWIPVAKEEPCSDNCGACGKKVTHKRECVPVGCECVHTIELEKTETCAINICPSPRPTCCKGFHRGVKGDNFVCLPQPENPVICNGTLSDWEPVESPICSVRCGGCGLAVTAKRRCVPEGCTCNPLEELEILQPCGQRICPPPMQDCCAGYNLVVEDGVHVCKPPFAPAEHCRGEYSEQRPVMEERPCSRTCGGCGVRVVKERVCEPTGCVCSIEKQPMTSTEPCGSALCTYPERSCCDGYSKAFDGPHLICAPINSTVA